MLDYDIHGSKGGGKKPHTPVETPNNLLSVAYAKVLIAVAEGELAGVPTDQDIFLDGTPLANPDGSKNFGGVKWEWRSGTSDQEYIQGMPEVSTEYNVGVELKSGFPWTRSVTKTQIDGVRVTVQWPALLKQEQNGDTVGISIDYKIDISTDGGPFVEYEKYTVTGKTNTSYERTHRVDLPKSRTGWTIRVTKITPDSQAGNVQDTMNIKSIAEVVDAKQRYPNTALLYVEFDSRMFGGGAIPRISVRTKGRLVRVPSNYDPENRLYSGIWDGSFKWAWTDNPAWVIFDILTQDRFGLGNKVNMNMVDKWSLYEIAQYCDVLVDKGDGSGEKEPRHTCNIYIQNKNDAWSVLRDLASIFNGMTYWNGNMFVAKADKQEPITNIPVFSRSNVVNGRFSYAAADDKSIYTSALVSYDEPTDHYNTQVESAFETSQILRWGGDRQTELTAIGCTSRGEAQRRAKYTLITNMYNRTVSFRTGLQGMSEDVMPGKIIHVTDPLIGGMPFTGRLVAATPTVITLDRDITARTGDIMYVTRSNGITEGRTIDSVRGNVVTLQTAYSETPLPNAVWYLETSELKSQLFRVTKVTSPEENVFEIEGVEYNDSKYAAIDNGARLEPRPISVVPPGIQQPPANPKITSSTYVEQTMAVTTMTFSWDQTPNAVSYEGQWKVNDGDWVNLGLTGANEFNVKGIYSGEYIARVRAINASGIKSVWSTTAQTKLEGKAGKPPTLANIVTTPMFFGIRLDWFFPEGASDTLRTEFMYSENEQFAMARPLGDFSYPTNSHEMHGLSAGKRFWFWCRLVDRTGNVGPWFPAQDQIGVVGESMINDNGQYNDYLAGMISETALDKLLYDRIQLIDGDGPGSVNERIEVVNDRVTETNNKIDQAVQDLEDQLANITDALAYDPTKTYVTGDIVRVDNRLYQAQKDVPLDTTPPNPEYWKDVGVILEEAGAVVEQVNVNTQKIEEVDGKVVAIGSSIEGITAQYRENDGEGELQDAIAGWDSRAFIIEERKVRADEDSALAERIITMGAKVDTNSANITELSRVTADQFEAVAEQINQLTVEVDTNVKAQIQEEARVRADADSALGTRITNLTTTVDNNNTTLGTRITTEETARADGDAALGSRIDTVVSAVDTEDRRLQAAITSEATTRADADSALGTRIDKVAADLVSEGKRLDASVTSEATARANADTALGTRIDTVNSRVTTETGTLSSRITTEETARANADTALGKRIDTVSASMITGAQVDAKIKVETDARVAADSAQASQITTLQTTVNGHTSSIQTISQTQTTTNGKLNSMWAVKMEHNSQGQYVAAGIGLGIENGPAGLQSQFLVRADRFAVVNGTTTTVTAPFVVQGGQVFIRQALIGDGWITNAMIGNVIQSNNFVANSTGWQINKAGTIQINGNVAGQGRLQISNNTILVYDTNNRLRVRLGIW